MYFIFIGLTNFKSVLCCRFCHNFLKHSKNYINFYFQFWSTPALGNSWFLLHIGSKHQTAEKNQGSADCGGIDLNKIINRQLQVIYVNPLLYSVSVSNFPSSGRGVLWNFNSDLTLKSALLLFTLVSSSKPRFKKRPVIVNRIKCL